MLQKLRSELSRSATALFLNEKSRRAILRIGATEEGILRKQLITDTGRIRDTVYFSILDSEWQQVKENLESSFFNRVSAFNFFTIDIIKNDLSILRKVSQIISAF